MSARIKQIFSLEARLCKALERRPHDTAYAVKLGRVRLRNEMRYVREVTLGSLLVTR